MKPLLEKIQAFTETLNRTEFYQFYDLATSMANPQCGDTIWIKGKPHNLKKITRLIRITVMFPRFNVDYGQAYTSETAIRDLEKLVALRIQLDNASQEAKSVDKLIGALNAIIASLGGGVVAEDFKGIRGVPVVRKT